MSQVVILKIEEDGHLHGGPAPRPWCAEITGLDPKYGLARSFVKALRDYKDAHRAWSGNVYGVIAHFPLHEGKLYEVSRLRGRPSKRYVSREFIFVEGGEMREKTPDEALAIATTIAHAQRSA